MMVKVADCQGVLLFDPRRRVAAAIHSGWRGSVQNILGKAVRLMAAEFHCRPADVIAGISPSWGRAAPNSATGVTSCRKVFSLPGKTHLLRFLGDQSGAAH